MQSPRALPSARHATNTTAAAATTRAQAASRRAPLATTPSTITWHRLSRITRRNTLHISLAVRTFHTRSSGAALRSAPRVLASLRAASRTSPELSPAEHKKSMLHPRTFANGAMPRRCNSATFATAARRASTGCLSHLGAIVGIENGMSARPRRHCGVSKCRWIAIANLDIRRAARPSASICTCCCGWADSMLKGGRAGGRWVTIQVFVQLPPRGQPACRWPAGGPAGRALQTVPRR